MQKEDALLYAFLADKISQCEKEQVVSYSYFLDARQRVLAEQFCRKKQIPSLLFWGGYEDAERTVCFFLPWYLSVEEFQNQLWEEAPFTVLRVEAKGEHTLTHRDYLGALIALGIKRELIGDLLVSAQGCDMLVFRKILPYLQANYEKAGRTPLSLREISFSQMHCPEEHRQEQQMTVSSLRLDVLVAAVFHLSRGKAEEAIENGIVFVNGVLVEKPEKSVQEDDKIVLRGKGKVLLKAIGNRTRKDKISITIEKYK